MNIPKFIKNAQSGDILCTKYNQLLMVEHVEIKDDKVNIYFYFNYDQEDGLYRNEWLTGFYGPLFEENFYREATKEEKDFFIELLKQHGYELQNFYNKMIPFNIRGLQ